VARAGHCPDDGDRHVRRRLGIFSFNPGKCVCPVRMAGHHARRHGADFGNADHSAGGGDHEKSPCRHDRLGLGAGRHSWLFDILLLQGIHRAHPAATFLEFQNVRDKSCSAHRQQPRLSIRLAQGRRFLGLAVVAHDRRLCDGGLPGDAVSRQAEAGILRADLCALCRLGRFGEHPLVLRIRGRGRHRQRHRKGRWDEFQNKDGSNRSPGSSR